MLIGARRFSGLLQHSHYKDKTLDQFIVGTQNGFLPRQNPLATLPDSFGPLDSLLERMPLTVQTGSGLLASGEFGAEVLKLPEFRTENISDSRLLTALFRDYSFVASAYLLEPCDVFNRSKDNYGLGRPVLPRNIAVPLAQIAAKIGAKPFMDYTLSYALYNYNRIDKNKGFEYENLKVIRSFSGMTSEYGFILVHVCMVGKLNVDLLAHSGNQVKHTLNALKSIEKDDRNQFDLELRGLLSTMQTINNIMETMWKRSLSSDYKKFRTFIMGIYIII
jgi:indoleamine 2,3-dioxygenase